MTKISKIAVVDDDGSVRDALAGLVRSLGLEAVGFSSADDFVARAAYAQIDCIITDVQMPGMSGVELLEFLRKEQCTVPVIVVTAYPSPATRARAMAAGAAHFLSKPFNGNEMVRCIEQVLAAP